MLSESLAAAAQDRTIGLMLYQADVPAGPWR
jgi:hypothetical protein